MATSEIKSVIASPGFQPELVFSSATIRCAIAGMIFLGLGLIYYAMTRDASIHYLLPVPAALKIGIMNLPGEWHNAFPSLAHTAGFSLLSIAIMMQPDVRSVRLAISIWSLLNLFLESMQAIPAAVMQTTGINEKWSNYLTAGVFDWLDLIAILLGAGLAYIVSIRSMNS